MTQIILEDNMLECSVCLETFDETCKMLPCQHTFCKRCLECIYEIDRSLQCPECRILVTTEIDRLPRNYFLLNIIEKIKSRSKDETSLAVDNEAVQLLFALKKSEDEAALQAQESDHRLQKEKLELELTLLKSKQSEPETPGDGLEYGFRSSENEIQENDDNGENDIRAAVEELPSYDGLAKQIVDEFSNLHIVGPPTEDANVTRSPDLHQWWKDLIVVLEAVADEQLFNDLTCEELEKYIEIIDNYMSALVEYYKKTCLYECTAEAPPAPVVPLTASSASGDADANSNVDVNIISDAERKNFAFALELSRQYFAASDEESLFELILKKSEVTHSIDKHKKSIQTLKEKIEMRMAVLISENANQ